MTNWQKIINWIYDNPKTIAITLIMETIVFIVYKLGGYPCAISFVSGMIFLIALEWLYRDV